MIFRVAVLIYCLATTPAAFSQCANSYSTFPVSFNFENDNGGWKPGGTLSDWAWGHPGKPIINRAGGGQKCWITGGLTNARYNGSEKSWLQAPQCFDFSAIQYPYISFKVFWELEKRYDGAGFQYSIDGGSTWENLGSANEAPDCNNKNWFNYTPISNLPVATVRDGWSGNIQPTQGICQGGNGSGSWLTASHTMYQLAYKKNVLFRFVFGSGSTCNDYDGFAVDDIVFSNHPPAPVIENLQYTNVACFGDFSASASVSISSGTPPYTVNWMNGAANYTGSAIVNLPAGAYNVTVKDASDCTVTQDFSILQPPKLAVSVVPGNASCNLNNGNAVVAGSGGVQPYNYIWQPTGASGNFVNNLAPGNYSAIIEDANGCKDTTAFDIENIGAVSVKINQVQNVDCFGNNTGSATASVAGSGPFTFSWLPVGGNAATASNLAPGNYMVKVTGTGGCMDSATAVVSEPTRLLVDLSMVNATCNQHNGIAQLGVSGGTVPYTYQWQPGNYTTATATNLAPGNYQYLVTDGNGCSSTGTAAIGNNGPPLITDIKVTDVKCFGDANGAAAVALQGGSSPYVINWTGNGNEYVGQLTNVPAGTYKFTIKDDSGCRVDSQIVIQQPTALTHTVAVNAISCTSTTGSATISEAGGVSPYVYSWSPGNYDGATVTGLAEGNYTANIFDQNGCADTARVNIQNISSLVVSADSVRQVSCYNGNDGAIRIAANNAVVNYNWQPAGPDAALNSNLKAGDYTVTVTDRQGCMATTNVRVYQPEQITIDVQAKATTCGLNNGSASVLATGGSGNIDFSWFPGNYNSAQPTQMAAGTFALTATDANGCKQSATVIIPSSEPLQPPLVETFAASCYNSANGSAAATMQNGTAPYTYTWTGPNFSSSATAVSGLIAGNYNLQAADAVGCQANAAFIIQQPAPLSHNVKLTPETCKNANGAASIIESGSAGQYQYSWSNISADQAAVSNLRAGSYVVNVSDANGCSDSIHISIENYGGVTISIDSIKNVSCNGLSDGYAAINAIGQALPFTYTWSPAAGSTNIAKNLPAASYTSTVTDQYGCKAEAVIDIKQPEPLQMNLISKNTTCNKNNGSATIATTGGTQPYAYDWFTSGLSGASVSALAPGTYRAEVTDANGCEILDSAIVSTSPGVKIAGMQTTDALCSGQAGGSAIPTVVGGSMPYQYTWINGNFTASNVQLQQAGAGTYALIVKDNDGCTDTARAVIGEPQPIAIAASTTATTCGLKNGGASAEVSGGVAPYKYQWSTGSSDPAINNMWAGNYRLTIIDANSCSVSNANIKVATSNPLKVSLGPDTTACPGNNIILAPGNFSSYTWQNNSHNSTFTATTTGRYSVTVSDTAGCVATAAINVNFTCTDLLFPSAFTPNNDRVNDQFGPLGTLSEVTNYSLKVFNRWGQVVFSSTSPYTRWDGRLNDSNMATGAFVWIAEYSFNKQPRKVKKGTLMLIR